MILKEIFEVITGLIQWLFDNLVIINIFLSVIIIFFERRDPKSVWAWLLLLYFIPIVGIVFYLVLGQDFKKSRMFRIKEVEDAISYEIRHQEEDLIEKRLGSLEMDYKEYEDMVFYNLETMGAVYSDNNQVEIYADGIKKFEALAEELKKAEKFIHMQYYIIKPDEAFDMIRPVLEKKAREGVEVRILYDSMGCRYMRKKHWNALREAGIQVAEFFPAKLKKLHLRINYRNHRKIVVIDGNVGFVGGFNIGREYLGKDEYFKYWRDTHLKIMGYAVQSLNLRFIMDWNFATKQNLFQNEYFQMDEKWIDDNAVTLQPGYSFQNVGVQIITSGPDSMIQNIRNNYVRMIHKAKHHIYIQTPYFIPDDSVLDAIQIAAMSGVDVRVMIPCKPDHMFVYWATYSYINDLLEAGAKCYTYEPGFLHAKGICVDGEVCCFGTANMDIRSFKLNFEVNTVIYDKEVTREMERLFEKDMEVSTLITSLTYGKRSRIIRIKEQISRLLSPIM